MYLRRIAKFVISLFMTCVEKQLKKYFSAVPNSYKFDFERTKCTETYIYIFFLIILYIL